jgi:hypothetical protein
MRIFIVVALASICTLSSCITMLQRLATRDNIVIDDHLIGDWHSADSKIIHVQKMMESKYKPTKAELDKHDYTESDSIYYSKFYVISFQENNIDYWWLGGLVRINGQYYLNFLPQECLNRSGQESYKLPNQSFIETSSIAKVSWDKNGQLSLHFFNAEKIKKIILNGNARISHEYDPLFDNIIITASPTELKQFLEKYGNNEFLYNRGTTINLSRKS